MFRSFFVLSMWLCATAVCHAQDGPGPLADNAFQAAVPPLRIAVVTDGDAPIIERYVQVVREQLIDLDAGGHQVEFVRDPAWVGDWTLPGAQAALADALQREAIQQVMAIGLASTVAAAQWEGDLPIPVMGTFLPHELSPMPLPIDDQGNSTKANFTYITMRKGLLQDLQALKTLANPGAIHLAIEQTAVDILQLPNDNFRAFEAEIGLPLKLLPVRASAAETLQHHATQEDSATIEAVMMLYLVSFPEQERERLINQLTAQRVATMSIGGREDVERGVLMGLAYQVFDRLASHTAMNAYLLARGMGTGELNVYMPRSDRLLINMSTVRSANINIPYVMRRDAEFIDNDTRQSQPLSINQAIDIALENNYEILTREADLDVALQQAKVVRGNLLPQLSLNLSGQTIDPTPNFTPERQIDWGAGLTQVLYDDAIWAQFRVANRQAEAAQFELEETRLDIIQATHNAFLTALATAATLGIRESDLSLTIENLDLARLRTQVGLAGPEELLRWESEEARRRAAVLQARSTFDQSISALNQVLAVPIAQRWTLSDPQLADGQLGFLDDVLNIDDLMGLAQFKAFAFAYAQDNDPLLQAIERSVDAAGILVRQQRRGWLVPSVSLQAQYGDPIDYEWDDTPEAFRDEEDRWQVGIFAELKLIEGGAKFAELSRRRADQRSIRQQYALARDNVDRQLSDAFDAAAADFPNRELQNIAAERSAENLEVLQTKYSRGTATLTELLDAQNQSVQASLSSAQATYQYLGTIVNLQRRLTWFESVADADQRGEFLNQLQAFEQQAAQEHSVEE